MTDSKVDRNRMEPDMFLECLDLQPRKSPTTDKNVKQKIYTKDDKKILELDLPEDGGTITTEETEFHDVLVSNKNPEVTFTKKVEIGSSFNMTCQHLKFLAKGSVGEDLFIEVFDDTKSASIECPEDFSIGGHVGIKTTKGCAKGSFTFLPTTHNISNGIFRIEYNPPEPSVEDLSIKDAQTKN